MPRRVTQIVVRRRRTAQFPARFFDQRRGGKSRPVVGVFARPVSPKQPITNEVSGCPLVIFIDKWHGFFWETWHPACLPGRLPIITFRFAIGPRGSSRPSASLEVQRSSRTSEGTAPRRGSGSNGEKNNDLPERASAQSTVIKKPQDFRERSHDFAGVRFSRTALPCEFSNQPLGDGFRDGEMR
jgi:hypothetical protein